MMSTKRIHRIVIFLSLATLALSGCTFIRVQNIADSGLRVRVQTPDGDQASTRYIEGGGIVEVFTAEGGAFTVSTLPDEQYREILEKLQSDISNRLFEEQGTLTASEVSQLVQNMQQIEKLLADLAAENQVTCSGFVPDFETAIVTAYYDTEADRWTLNCGGG